MTLWNSDIDAEGDLMYELFWSVFLQDYHRGIVGIALFCHWSGRRT